MSAEVNGVQPEKDWEISAFHPGELKKDEKVFRCMLWNKNDTVRSIKEQGYTIISTEYFTGCKVFFTAKKVEQIVKKDV